MLWTLYETRYLWLMFMCHFDSLKRGCPGLGKRIYFLSGNSATLAGLCLVLQSSPMNLNSDELQYQIQAKDRCCTIAGQKNKQIIFEIPLKGYSSICGNRIP